MLIKFFLILPPKALGRRAAGESSMCPFRFQLRTSALETGLPPASSTGVRRGKVNMVIFLSILLNLCQVAEHLFSSLLVLKNRSSLEITGLQGTPVHG